MFYSSINQFPQPLLTQYISDHSVTLVFVDYFHFHLLLLQRCCCELQCSRAKVREHQQAPLRHSFEQHLICEGNLSHKQPRGDFNIYSAVCSAYVSFGKQLTLAHYTQMKADLQTGQRPHSLCGEVSPSYEAMALSPPPSTLPMHIEQHPGPIANERAPADMMYTVHQYGPDVF